MPTAKPLSVRSYSLHLRRCNALSRVLPLRSCRRRTSPTVATIVGVCGGEITFTSDRPAVYHSQSSNQASCSRQQTCFAGMARR